MLVAHLVPGYVAYVRVADSGAARDWTRPQRALLWITALGSTIAPDIDVIYNALVRGFFNHSTLWTHSLFVYVGIALLCWFWPGKTYTRTLIGLVALGGLSHLALDMVAHNTPLFYPLSMTMVGIAPSSIVAGGVRAYLTHPLFALELILVAASCIHFWLRIRDATPRTLDMFDDLPPEGGMS